MEYGEVQYYILKIDTCSPLHIFSELQNTRNGDLNNHNY